MINYYALKDEASENNCFAVVRFHYHEKLEEFKRKLLVALEEEYDEDVSIVNELNLHPCDHGDNTSIEIKIGEYLTTIEITKTWVY